MIVITLFLCIASIACELHATMADYMLLGSQVMEEARLLCNTSRKEADYQALQARVMQQYPWYVRWVDKVGRFIEPSKEAQLADIWQQLGLTVRDSLHGLVLYQPYAYALWSDNEVQVKLLEAFGLRADFRNLETQMKKLQDIYAQITRKIEQPHPWWSLRLYQLYKNSESECSGILWSLMDIYLQIVLTVNRLEPAEMEGHHYFRPLFMHAMTHATTKVQLLKQRLERIDMSLVNRWYHDLVTMQLISFIARQCMLVKPLSTRLP